VIRYRGISKRRTKIRALKNLGIPILEPSRVRRQIIFYASVYAKSAANADRIEPCWVPDLVTIL